jgi:hypothetical protein
MAEPNEPGSNHEHEEISIEVMCLTLGYWKDDNVLDSAEKESWKQDEMIGGTLRQFPATQGKYSMLQRSFHLVVIKVLLASNMVINTTTFDSEDNIPIPRFFCGASYLYLSI